MHVDRDCSADADAYRDENAYPSARHSYPDRVANKNQHARRDANADRIANTDPHTDYFTHSITWLPTQRPAIS